MSDRVRPPVVIVLTTAPDVPTAESLAERVVEERLAACANLLTGARSVYRWEGEVQREAEVVVLLKTTAPGVDALQDRLTELHPYDVPELLVLRVERGAEPYLDWVRREVGAGP